MNLNIPKLYFGLLLLGISGFFFTMFLPHPQGFYAFVVVVGLAGFGVAANIYYVKRHKKQLVCPIGTDCNAVIKSRYSKFFGIPLEYLGLAYFAVTVVTYSVLIVSPHLLTETALIGVIALTVAAFLFSSYLLFVQAFLLRQWCIWCILASMFSLTIFFISLINLDAAVNFLASIGNVLSMFQFLGFALGMGGATAAVFLFYKFLRDLDIDAKEMDVLQGISELIWLGFGIVLMIQFAFYAANPEVLAQSSTFIARIISLFAVALSGAFLMIIFAPFLAYIPFAEKPERHRPSSLESLRKPTFVIGAIALSSWYFAFVTNFIPEYNLGTLLMVYVAFVLAAVITSLIWESAIVEKGFHKK